MSKKYLAIVAAATLAAGTMSMNAWAQQANSAADRAANTARDTANKTADAARDTANDVSNRADRAASNLAGEVSPHADDVRKVLADVVEQGVQGDVNGVAGYFTDNSEDQFKHHGKDANAVASGQTDKDAAKEAGKQAEDQVKETAKQFREAWKAKYNHDFDLDRKNEPMVFSGDMVMIMKGDVSPQARTAGARIGADANNADSKSNEAGTANAQSDKTVGEKITSGRTDASGAATNLQDRMATVMIKESHGMPMVSLPLANEGTFGNKWRIQPPPGLTYQTLADNLNTSLQHCLSMKDSWPADENEAYRAASHSILAAIANTPPGSSNANATGNQNTDAAQPAGATSTPPSQPQK
jgi:hypothetical protein